MDKTFKDEKFIYKINSAIDALGFLKKVYTLYFTNYRIIDEKTVGATPGVLAGLVFGELITDNILTQSGNAKASNNNERNIDELISDSKS